MIEYGKKVVITTQYRGVFFGTLADYDRAERTVVITAARNCVFWPTKNRGFLGLATDGPKSGARIGPAADLTELAGVTSVTLCSDNAATKWEEAPWS